MDDAIFSWRDRVKTGYQHASPRRVVGSIQTPEILFVVWLRPFGPKSLSGLKAVLFSFSFGADQRSTRICDPVQIPTTGSETPGAPKDSFRSAERRNRGADFLSRRAALSGASYLLTITNFLT